MANEPKKPAQQPKPAQSSYSQRKPAEPDFRKESQDRPLRKPGITTDHNIRDQRWQDKSTTVTDWDKPQPPVKKEKS
jgi:hypothetical protein